MAAFMEKGSPAWRIWDVHGRVTYRVTSRRFIARRARIITDTPHSLQSVMTATLANRQDATPGRTRYHAGVVRPGEWLDGEKNDVRYP